MILKNDFNWSDIADYSNATSSHLNLLLASRDGPAMSVCVKDLFDNSTNEACGEIEFLADFGIALMASIFKIGHCRYLVCILKSTTN